MDAYLYEIFNFSLFSDEDEYPEETENKTDDWNSETCLRERKIKDILPMMSGFFHVGFNYVELFEHENAGRYAKPMMIYNGEFQRMTNANFSLLLPYKDMAFAKKLAVKELEEAGYMTAAASIKRNKVYTISSISPTVTREDKAYVKKLDKQLMKEKLSSSEK